MGENNSKQQFEFEEFEMLRRTTLTSKTSKKKISNNKKDKIIDTYSLIFTQYFPQRKKTIIDYSFPQIEKLNNSFSFSNSHYYTSMQDILIKYQNTITKAKYHSISLNNTKLLNESYFPDIDNHILLSKPSNHNNKSQKLRKDFLAKLITTHIWKPHIKEKTSNTIFIFDWDDTLMCSSFLIPTGIFKNTIQINNADCENIKNIDIKVCELLKRCIALGEVYIITNAIAGWVEFSADKFYKETVNVINKVNVISARTKYEKKFPGMARKWKFWVFEDIVKKFNTQLLTNLICFGDSIIEIEAAHNLIMKFMNGYIKTIKFKENPLPVELLREINVVLNQFEKIVSSPNNLTIKVGKKSKRR